MRNSECVDPRSEFRIANSTMSVTAYIALGSNLGDRKAILDGAIQALRDKCGILWAQLDALYFAYVQPGWPPPGAFKIEGA